MNEENNINEETYLSDVESVEPTASVTAGDDPNFDKHATQFVGSLATGATPIDMYWHGRLIGWGANELGVWKPYKINFFGTELTEEQFRQKIESGEIVINSFSLSVGETPGYASNANSSALNLDAHILTYKADISATINGIDKNGQVCITEYIRKTYQSYRTEIDDCP